MDCRYSPMCVSVKKKAVLFSQLGLKWNEDGVGERGRNEIFDTMKHRIANIVNSK